MNCHMNSEPQSSLAEDLPTPHHLLREDKGSREVNYGAEILWQYHGN